MLPPEILNEIFVECDIMDLKSLRLVNKCFAENAARELFYEIFCILLPESMQKIRNIVKYPFLRHYVRSFVYFGDRFDDEYAHFQIWKIHALKGRPCTKAAYSKFQRFCEISRSQDRLIKQSQESRFLMWAMNQLHGVCSITLASQTEYRADIDGDREQDKLPIFPKLAQQTLLSLAHLTCNANHNTQESFAIFSFLEVMGKSGRLFQEVTLQGITFDFLSDVEGRALYPLIKPLLETSLTTVFSSTISLYLILNVGDMGRISDHHSPISRLCDFICLTQCARRIILCLYSVTRPNSAYGQLEETSFQTDITDFFSGVWCKGLEYLALTNVACSVDDFVIALCRIAGTICSLDLCNVKLTCKGPSKVNKKTGQPMSPWEYAVHELASVLYLDEIEGRNMTDDWSHDRIAQGDQNGIPLAWLYEGHFKGLLYLAHIEPDFPIYGKPKISEVLGLHCYFVDYHGELEDFNNETYWQGMKSVMVKLEDKIGDETASAPST